MHHHHLTNLYLQSIKHLSFIPRALHRRKTSYPDPPTIETLPLIKPTEPTIFPPMSDISVIPSSSPAFLIATHLSPRLLPIPSSFFPPQTSNQELQPPFRSLYSEIADALLLAAALDIEESDKNDVEEVGIEDELNTQTEFEGHFVFLIEDLLIWTTS